MKILLTNDDGINAPGLYALYKEFIKTEEVNIVAPDSEKSAVGHAITLSDPLRVTNFYKNDFFFGYAVNGTPADCVKLAYWALDIKPDIVISGINLGSNTGINILYSGTVSAATEGMFLDVPSIAISLTTFHNPDFRFAARFAHRLSKIVIEHDGEMVDGSSILDILTLGCPYGETLTIKADGDDALEAMDALEQLIENKFGEE